MTDVLQAPATQASFAEIVGVSRQAITKLAPRIGLDRKGTHGDWLRTYCEHLRTEAAGRGGDSMVNLTMQRISESEQKTLAMSLDNMEKLGLLIVVEDMSRVFDEFASAVPVSFNGAGETILGAIDSKYSITVDDELVYKPLRAAAERLAGVARKLSEGIRQSS